VNGVFKGCLLGIANVVLIAIGLASAEGSAGVMTLVFVFGGLPGVLAGAGLGALAQVIGTSPVPVRICVLVTPAVAVVFGLAHEFGMQDLWLISCIPTVVAALILERWTRVVEAPPVPVAKIAA
jgi:hypothetical protein